MERYRFGFALTTALGNRTRYENIRAHAQRYPDVDFVWAPISHWLDPDPYERFPDPLRRQLIVNHEAREIRARWSRLDAVVVHAFQLFAWLSLRPRRQGGPLLVLAQDYAPFTTAEMLSAYGQDARDGLPRRLRVDLERWFTRRADLFLPWSSWVEESLVREARVDPAHVHVIPPGVDLEAWPYVPPDSDATRPTRILFVGGDLHRKGGDLLLEAVAGLDRDVHLDIVTRDEVAAVPSNVTVHNGLGPNDPELRRLYGAADLFALPTRADMYSIVALEAMATGRPVVSTSVGGIPDIVRPHETGLLVEPDDVRGLRAALTELIDDPEVRISMGRRAREVAEEQFGIRGTTDRMVSVLRSAVDERRAARGAAPPGAVRSPAP